MRASENISVFLDFLRDSAQDLNIATEVESEANDETQDILHAVELGTTSTKPSVIIKKLKAVRAKRRQNKDTIETLAPIVQWAENNKTTVKSLEQLLGTVRKAESRIDGRMYMPRTNILEE